MSSVLRRFPTILLISAFAIAAPPALAKDAKPANPNVSAIKGESMDDKHKGMLSSGADPGTDTSARDPQTGLPTGKRMHKPMVITKRCDTHDAQPANGVASDPEEGGQIARTGGGSSDPEEGGEATTATKTAKGKVHVSDINVSKASDKSSSSLFKETSPSDCH